MKKTVLALFCAAAAWAQPPAPPAPPAPPSPPDAPMMVEFLRTESANLSGKAIKGVPYSAEGVNEVTQVLADGNKITRKTSSSVYRDSQGRTRNEHSLGDVGPWASKGEKIVNIFDPVAKQSITLHPDKTATKFQTMGPFMSDMKWVESNGGNTMTFERRVAAPVAGVAVQGAVIGGMAAPAMTRHMEVRQDVVIERAPGMAAASTAAFFVAGDGVGSKHTFNRESLGKKVIEGVEAEGHRSVMTIPAGEIGNDRPIEVVDETWFSNELEALVYSRHSDPRTGEHSYRLTNIQRGEQPAYLFEVPADYKVHEGPGGRMEMKIRTKKPE